MNIYIVGICGTFMCGIARLATELGHKISGCDANIYPPMSEQLKALGVDVNEGYECPERMEAIDLFLIGNVAKRGMPIIEAILSHKYTYQSAPEWLYNNVLRHRKVYCVTGTHGKTTTTAMLLHIFHTSGKSAGYLIGGIPGSSEFSASLGDCSEFIIEGDEYDSAFFDKRAKFIHYHPDVCVINNLEFDHADIYPNIMAIEREFKHLINIMPQNAQLIYPLNNISIESILSSGTFCHQNILGKDYYIEPLREDYSQFKVIAIAEEASITWHHFGIHQAQNALSAITMAKCAGISLETSAKALESYQHVKRRMQNIGTKEGIYIYDDFAHHPTAIKYTTQALRLHNPGAWIIACIELGSYSMKNGMHNDNYLHDVLKYTDFVYLFAGKTSKKPQINTRKIKIFEDINDLLDDLLANRKEMMHVVFMSNKGFAKAPTSLLERLSA